MGNKKMLAAVGRWGILLPAALIVGLGGLAKFTDAQNWRDMFVAWGYPAWMSPVTGALEMAGAVAMILPWTRFWGALLVALVMLAAFLTRLVHAEFLLAIIPLVVIALALQTAWWSRPAWVRARLARK